MSGDMEVTSQVGGQNKATDPILVDEDQPVWTISFLDLMSCDDEIFAVDTLTHVARSSPASLDAFHHDTYHEAENLGYFILFDHPFAHLSSETSFDASFPDKPWINATDYGQGNPDIWNVSAQEMECSSNIYQLEDSHTLSLDSAYVYRPQDGNHSLPAPFVYVPWNGPYMQRPAERQPLCTHFPSGKYACGNDDSMKETKTDDLNPASNVSEGMAPRVVHADAIPVTFIFEKGWAVPKVSHRQVGPEQRARSLAVRHAGGQCTFCRKNKRRCDPSHRFRRRASLPGLRVPGSAAALSGVGGVTT